MDIESTDNTLLYSQTETPLSVDRPKRKMNQVLDEDTLQGLMFQVSSIDDTEMGKIEQLITATNQTPLYLTCKPPSRQGSPTKHLQLQQSLFKPAQFGDFKPTSFVSEHKTDKIERPSPERPTLSDKTPESTSPRRRNSLTHLTKIPSQGELIDFEEFNTTYLGIARPSTDTSPNNNNSPLNSGSTNSNNIADRNAQTNTSNGVPTNASNNSNANPVVDTIPTVQPVVKFGSFSTYEKRQKRSGVNSSDNQAIDVQPFIQRDIVRKLVRPQQRSLVDLKQFINSQHTFLLAPEQKSASTYIRDLNNNNYIPDETLYSYTNTPENMSRSHNLNNANTSPPDSDQKKLSWSFNSILKGEDQDKDLSLVGVGTLDNCQVIYKISRLPGWGHVWENAFYRIIEEYTPSIKSQFAKCIAITKIPLACDKKGRALPCHKSDRFPSRVCDMLIQKMVPGVSFAEQITQEKSYRKLFSGTLQVLNLLEILQHTIKGTHNDVHSNNILMKPIKEGRDVYMLYDVVPTIKPFAVHAQDKEVVIIDYEFSAAHPRDGSSVDCSFDLIHRGYDPTSFDPSIDSLRFVIGTFSFYYCTHEEKTEEKIKRKEMGNKYKMERKKFKDTELIGSMAEYFIDSVNSHEAGIITEEGTLESCPDTVYDNLIAMAELRSLSGQDYTFIKKKLYHILALISHRIKLPLQRRTETPDCRTVARVIEALFQLQTSCPEHKMIILYKLIANPSIEVSELKGMFESMEVKLKSDLSFWLSNIQLQIINCLPHLESALFYAQRENRERRRKQYEEEYTPTKMKEWLTGKYRLCSPLTSKTVIYWMNKHKRVKVPLTRVSKSRLDKLNIIKDHYEFSAQLKKLVEKVTNNSTN